MALLQELGVYDEASGSLDRVDAGNPLPIQAPLGLSLTPANSAISVAAVTVATTATPLVTNPLPQRKSIAIFNSDTASIYLGPATVTSGTGAATAGFDMPANTSFALDLGPGVTLFGISAAGTASNAVKVFQVS